MWCRGPTSMPRWSAVATVLAVGCGRISFTELRTDGAVDGAAVDGAIDGAIDAPGMVTKILGATADTTLVMAEPTRNLGAAAALTVDDSTSAILRFDLAAIPTAASVVSASLTIWTMPGSSTPNSVEAFELLEPWVEGTGTDIVVMEPASYDERLPGTAWSSPGAGDASRGVRIAAVTPMTGDAPYTSQLASVVVAKWIAQPSTNHGMVFDLNGNNDVALVSRENPSATKRPVLTVLYLP